VQLAAQNEQAGFAETGLESHYFGHCPEGSIVLKITKRAESFAFRGSQACGCDAF
jgi:hypothetical protein